MTRLPCADAKVLGTEKRCRQINSRRVVQGLCPLPSEIPTILLSTASRRELEDGLPWRVGYGTSQRSPNGWRDGAVDLRI